MAQPLLGRRGVSFLAHADAKPSAVCVGIIPDRPLGSLVSGACSASRARAMLATPALAPAVRSLPRRRARLPSPGPRTPPRAFPRTSSRGPRRRRARARRRPRRRALRGGLRDGVPPPLLLLLLAPGPPAPRATWRVTTSGALSGLERHEDVQPPRPRRDPRRRQGHRPQRRVFGALGLYRAAPPCPFVPGLELSGIVAEIGFGADLPPGAVVPEYALGGCDARVTRRRVRPRSPR